MKIACASDAHHAYRNEERLIDILPRVDAFCFLGDVEDDGDCLRLLLSDKQPHALFYAVAGNNDLFSKLPRTMELSFGDVRVLITHGHLFRTRQAMIDRAKAQGCLLALHGHTHRPIHEVVDGVHVVNPGALKAGQWALIDIDDPLKVELRVL